MTADVLRVTITGVRGFYVRGLSGPIIDHVESAPDRALAHVTSMSSGDPLGEHLRVTLNFHPDRLASGLLVLEAMGHDGVYRSQFETGTSNGGLTAHPGGARWGWESRIFGTAYDHAPAAERPKYGSLNFRRRAAGGSPRFGSSHLRLRPQTLARTTFCYPDSFLEPDNFGVASAMSLIALAAADDPDDPLDDYIEAQVHGPVLLRRDVEAVVLDPSFRGTRVEQAASELGCPVEWHGGFTLSKAELTQHPDYRGPRYVRLGTEIAEAGRLDPRIIGDASRTGRYDQQDLKRVWHYLARFGSPGCTPLRTLLLMRAEAGVVLGDVLQRTGGSYLARSYCRSGCRYRHLVTAASVYTG